MARGRKAVEVDIKKLTETIRGIENKQTFNNRTELYEAVASSAWGKSINLTASVVYLRVKENNLSKDIKTPMGRRGKAPGVTLTDEQKKAMIEGRRARKSKGHSEYNELYDTIRSRKIAGISDSLINRAQTGSLAAAIKLNCLICCCGDKKAIKECTAQTCPMLPHRPYRVDVNESDESDA
jgi:hypothetical protein